MPLLEARTAPPREEPDARVRFVWTTAGKVRRVDPRGRELSPLFEPLPRAEASAPPRWRLEPPK